MNSISNRIYLALSGTIFLLVSLLHLLRLIYGWPILVGSFVVPYSLSYIGCPVAFAYGVWAYWLCRTAR